MTKSRHPEKINKPFNPIKKKPSWIRSKILDSKIFFKTKEVVNQSGLNTVCQEANCPNITECWSKKHATFMIMGDTCTRGCAFCDVKTGKPNKLDPFEPQKISKAVSELNLNHVVITSVDRDDLQDGGANHFKEVVFETKNKEFFACSEKDSILQRGFNPIQFVLAQGREKIPRSYRDGNPDDELERRRKLMLRAPSSSNLNSAIRRGCRMGSRKRLDRRPPEAVRPTSCSTIRSWE